MNNIIQLMGTWGEMSYKICTMLRTFGWMVLHKLSQLLLYREVIWRIFALILLPYKRADHEG